MTHSVSSRAFLAGCVAVAIGLAATGVGVFCGIKYYQDHQRYVTVKGLAEREVQADLAVWPLRFVVAGNDLAKTSALLEEHRQKLVKFLEASGFSAEDWSTGPSRVMDLSAQNYNSGIVPTNRYILETSVTLRTGKFEAVAKAVEGLQGLIRDGLVLQENQGPTYRFTGLNAIKPELIAEATRNARASAEQFAEDSGSTVGEIRSANQGVISIAERDMANVTETEGYNPGIAGVSNVMKTVRVVATVQYYLQ